MISKEDILKSLSNVLDPVAKKDLVSLEAIKNIKILKNKIKIEILTSSFLFL